MARTLRIGTQIIRIALVTGLLLAGAGIYFSYALATLPPGAPAPPAFAPLVCAVLATNVAIFLAVLWMLAARKLLPRVKILAGSMDRGADGDLTVRTENLGEDELGRLAFTFNTMIERLGTMVRRVNTSVAELRTITASVREVAERESSTAEIQSCAVKGTAVAAHQISGSVSEVADSVESLSRSASHNAGLIAEMSARIEDVAASVEALSQAVDEVSSSIVEMAAAEREIHVSVKSLMDNASKTAMLVTELDSSIKQVEKNALGTADITTIVLADAEQGRESVETTISGISEIRRSTRTVSMAIENLSVRAGTIGSILSVIDEVAEQTTLLALNASIIAAQAGEHGRGFAVVANQIKELAKRTTSSTRKIADIITGVQEETDQAVQAIRQSEQRVVEGERLSQRSGEALDKIVGGVKMAAGQVGEIARTTVQQAQGSENMRRAMGQVAEMVEQIVRATQEQTHGGELIMAAVERMRSLTGQVNESSREQRTAGDLIVHSSEGITRMIATIRQACQVQMENTGRIVQAVANMDLASRSNVEATQVMDDSVAGLTRQIDLLDGEMNSFKI